MAGREIPRRTPASLRSRGSDTRCGAGLESWSCKPPVSRCSEENTHVLGRQYVLVQHQLAAGDLPGAVDAPQYILAGADKEVLFGFGAAAVDDEIRINLQLGIRVARLDLDMGDQVAGARRRVFCPRHAGVETGDAAGERLFGFVEDREFVLHRLVVLDIAVGVEDRDRLARFRIAVAAAGHPVADIVGEQRDPLVKPPIVQQACLPVEELLDFADQILVTHIASLAPARRPARASPPASSDRPSGGRTAGGYFRSCGTRWPTRRDPGRSGRARDPSACSMACGETRRRGRSACIPANCPCRLAQTSPTG